MKKSQTNPQELTLRIKPNTPLPSSTDPTITVPTTATVYTLKQTIATQLHFQKRYIRLIHSGRLLAPDDAILTSFGMKNDAVVHCVVAKEGVSGGIQALLAKSNPNNNSEDYDRSDSNGNNADRRSGIGVDGRIHASRRRLRSLWGNTTTNTTTEFEHPHDSESDHDEIEGQEEGRLVRRGFDRLRNQGFSRSEINAIRIYFSNQVHDYMTRQEEEGLRPSMETDEDPETILRNRTLRAEEEWMELQGPHSEFQINLNADNYLYRRRLWFDLGGRRRRTRQAVPEREGITPLSMGNEDNETHDPRSSMASIVNNGGLHMYGPLGTDRDFIWGFVLAYLCGFVMMFWVMNPTVAHRQKLGILTGLCFHILLHIFETTTSTHEEESKEMQENLILNTKLD
jgi:hypothetical protein